MTKPEVRIVDPQARAGPWGAVRTYVELTKPRIIELLLVTTVPAMIAADGGWPGWYLVLTTLFGGTLSAAGASVINQVLDRDIDAVMSRTAGRPLPTGRVSATSALVFGVVLGVAGFVWLALATNLLAAWLSMAGLLFYVLVYTMLLKRTTTQNIVLGGIAGGAPVLVGWAAVSGELAVGAWVMFAIVFFWTPPHFWALAIRYSDDYSRAGVPMLPSVVGVETTTKHILSYTIVVTGTSLLLFPVVPMGWIYLVVAAALALWLVVGAVRLVERPERAMSYFILTNVYLASLFAAIALDRLVL